MIRCAMRHDVHDLRTARKLGVWRLSALYRVNQCFANIVSQGAEPQELKILDANAARRYRSSVQELQAEMNRGLADLIETAESRARLPLIKARKVREREN